MLRFEVTKSQARLWAPRIIHKLTRQASKLTSISPQTILLHHECKG